MLVVHGLQVHLVEVDPGTDVVEHLRRPVAVGDVGRVEVSPLGFAEDRDGPFGGDERLVVGGHHGRRAALSGEPGEGFRREVAWLADGLRVADRLRREPVLAVRAVKVAAEHTEGKSVGAGQRVEEGLLLDGIALEGPDVAPGHLQDAPFVVTDAADALAPLRDRAPVPAGVAAQAPILEALDELGRGGRRASRQCRGDGRRGHGVQQDNAARKEEMPSRRGAL